MTAQITVSLGLPDVRVSAVEVNRRDNYIITVESTLEQARCRKCGRTITKFRGHDRWLTLRHLPVLGHQVYIRLRPKRYQCPHCPGQPTSTQELAWHEPNSPHTKAYEQHVLLVLVNATVQDVSIKEALGYDAVVGIVDRHIEREVDWQEYQCLAVLGLDEIALKKGRSDYVVIVTARLANGQVKILSVLPDREKQTVVKFLRSIPARLRPTIHTVCTDMYAGFVNAAKEVLPAATVVVDRYHVAKKYREGADLLRRQELKRLKRELSADEYEQIKGAMWPFRKNGADLTAEEQALLERVFACSPKLREAYRLREELTAIFERQLTKADAEAAIKDWQRKVEESPLVCFDGFLTTLENHLDEITNYFLHRHNSGFVEGLNNKIKVLKRRSYVSLSYNLHPDPTRFCLTPSAV